MAFGNTAPFALGSCTWFDVLDDILIGIYIDQTMLLGFFVLFLITISYLSVGVASVVCAMSAFVGTGDLEYWTWLHDI